jgi:hypothetical protein
MSQYAYTYRTARADQVWDAEIMCQVDSNVWLCSYPLVPFEIFGNIRVAIALAQDAGVKSR